MRMALAHRATGNLLLHAPSYSWRARAARTLRVAACPSCQPLPDRRQSAAGLHLRLIGAARTFATEAAASHDLESVKLVLDEQEEPSGNVAAADAPGPYPSGRKKWAQVDKELLQREHTVSEAVALIKALAVSNFDEGVDCVMKLGLDPRRAEHQIRGMATLPYNTGKQVRICVFAEPELQEGLAERGAEWVGGTDLMDSILAGDVPIDFNRCLASPSIMPVLGEKLGRLLGPKKLMPNVKVGTVTSDLGAGIDSALKGQAMYRLDKGANVHANIGRASMDEELLVENALALIQAVVDAQPAKKRTKGGKSGGKAMGTSVRYVEKVSMSSTMGKSLKIRRMSLNLSKSTADDE